MRPPGLLPGWLVALRASWIINAGEHPLVTICSVGLGVPIIPTMGEQGYETGHGPSQLTVQGRPCSSMCSLCFQKLPCLCLLYSELWEAVGES